MIQSRCEEARSRVICGRLEDWRRIYTHYDRCPHTVMSAISIAATVIFCFN